jgi:hypothetical protein
MRPQPLKLLRNCLGLLLAAGRDPGIQADFQNSPPVQVLTGVRFTPSRPLQDAA